MPERRLPLTGLGDKSRSPNERLSQKSTGVPAPNTAREDTEPARSPLEVAITGKTPTVRRQRTPRQSRVPVPKITSNLKWGKVGVSLVVASRRPGFLARITTASVMYAIMLFLIANIFTGTALIIVLVLVFTSILIMIKSLSASAHRPLPEVSEYALLPKEGVPKYAFALLKLYGSNRIPALTAKQQLEELIQLLENRLRELYRYVQPTIWVGNQKGGAAKTILSVVGGNILAGALGGGRPIVLLSTSANTSTGTAGDLAGLKGKSLTVREYYRHLMEERFKVPRDLFEHLHNTEGTSLFVVTEDPGGNATEGYLRADQYAKVYQHARDNSALVIQDTGNDGANKGSVTEEAMEKAGVVIVSAWTGLPQTIKKAGETIADYMTYAENEGRVYLGQTRQRKTGEDVPLKDKITNAVVVINGLKPGEDPEDYRSAISNGYGGPFEGQILGVRWDEYLHALTENYDQRKLGKGTRFDVLLIMVVAFERAAQLLGIELPPPHPAIAGMIDLTTPPTI